MSTLNTLDPTPEQIRDFLGHPKSDQPVFMLNLLKFKDRAEYKDGEDISGRAAYARYAKAFGEMVKAKGDSTDVVFGGNINAFLIGSGEGAGLDAPEWDAVAIVKYPDAQTMFSVVSSDEYRAIHKHRRAGLAGQLLISCDGEGMF